MERGVHRGRSVKRVGMGGCLLRETAGTGGAGASGTASAAQEGEGTGRREAREVCGGSGGDSGYGRG
eukprot:167842-Chlamydomonas_euryale.AAC.1